MCESAVGVRAVPVSGLESAGLGDGACVASLLAALICIRSGVAGRKDVVPSAVRKSVYEFAVRPVAYAIITLVEALFTDFRHAIGVEAYYTALKYRVNRVGHRDLVVGAMGKLMSEDATVHHALPAILLVPARPSRSTGGFGAKDKWLARLPCVVLDDV
jgi:hypothetical protein